MTLFGPPSPGHLGAQLFPLPAVAVGTTDFDVDLGGQHLQPGAVKLANRSQLVLQLDLAGLVDYLAPGEINVFPAGGASKLHVHPIVPTVPPPPGPTSELLVTLAPPGESFPGVFPAFNPQQIASSSPVNPLLVNPGDPQPYSVTSTGLQTFAFPIPARAQSVRFQFAFGGITFTGWKVFGDVTGVMNNYWALSDQATGPTTAFDITFRLHPVDKVLTLTFNVTALGAGTFRFLAESNLGIGDVVAELGGAEGTSPAEPLDVNLVSPALWQAPNKPPVPFSFTLAAGGTVTLVAGVAGQTVYLHDLDYVVGQLVANTFLLWQDSAGNLLSEDGTDLVTGPRSFRFSGAPLGASGRGTQVNNSGGAVGGSTRGHMTVGQG